MIWSLASFGALCLILVGAAGYVYTDSPRGTPCRSNPNQCA